MLRHCSSSKISKRHAPTSPSRPTSNRSPSNPTLRCQAFFTKFISVSYLHPKRNFRSIISSKRFVGHHERFVTIRHTYVTRAGNPFKTTSLSPGLREEVVLLLSPILETQIMPERIPPVLKNDEFDHSFSRGFNGHASTHCQLY